MHGCNREENHEVCYIAAASDDFQMSVPLPNPIESLFVWKFQLQDHLNTVDVHQHVLDEFLVAHTDPFYSLTFCMNELQ
jgi:hypothetical protein